MKIGEKNPLIHKNPFAYCRPAIRILQVGNSHTFNFSPHCFFIHSRRYCRADFIEYYTSKIPKRAISVLRTFSKSILHQLNALHINLLKYD